ncbi:MAG: hypothetical protein ACYC9Q_14985 [Bacillota bacterium]
MSGGEKHEAMTDEEYLQTQQQIELLAILTLQLDLDGFLERIRHAEAVVPIVDPSIWMKGGSALQKVKDLAEGLKQFKKAAEDVARRERR